MEYITSIGDFDKSKVKFLRVDTVYALTIYVTTDNKVLFLGSTSNAHGIVEYAYSFFKIHRYLKDNRESREWLYIHSDLSKEELDSYALTEDMFVKNEMDYRSKKSIEIKKAVLRKLMAEFPEVVKEVLVQNG